MMLINFICSIVLTIAFTFFIIFTFGRQSSKLNKLPWYESYLVKLGLGFCAAGALLNALTLSNPAWTEILLNCGLAILFIWASYFHYKEFVCTSTMKKKKNKSNKKIK